MGLSDDVERARAAHRAQRSEEEAWANVGGWQSDPVVTCPAGGWEELVREAVPLIRWNHRQPVRPPAHPGSEPPQWREGAVVIYRSYVGPDGKTRLTSKTHSTPSLRKKSLLQRWGDPDTGPTPLPGNLLECLRIRDANERGVPNQDSLLMTRSGLLWVDDWPYQGVTDNYKWAREVLAQYIALQ